MQLNIVLIVLLLLMAALAVEAQFKVHMANNRLFLAQEKGREFRSRQRTLEIERTKLLNPDRLNTVAGEMLQLVSIDLKSKQAVSISQALMTEGQSKGDTHE